MRQIELLLTVEKPFQGALKPFSSSLQTEEDRPTFRPFTRESLAQIEARILEDHEKKRELERKRAEGEVSTIIQMFYVFVRFDVFLSFSLFHFASSSFDVTMSKGQLTCQPAGL